jgi:hypothetical protein
MSAISLTDWVNQTQDQLRKGLVQKITNDSIFLRILRFIPIDGFTYHYSEQATLGGVAFRGFNQDYSADTGAVNPKIETIAIFGGQVETDRQLSGGSPTSPRASAIAAKLKKAGLFFDKYVIDGDPAVDKNQFYGINARLTGNQVIVAGANGATLTLAMLDDLLDRVAGRNEQKVLVMNKANRRKLKQLVLAQAGGAGIMDVGKSLSSYDNCPIEVIDEDGDEQPILAFDETQGTSNLTVSIYCLRPGQDPEGEMVQGLVKSTMIEHEDQGVRGTKYIDLVEAAMGLAVFHGRAAARLKGITNT